MKQRDPEAAAETTYDLTVIGGGVYGIALCLEAARRGFSTLLIESGDYGGATSWNSLRILHGGLRYLQTLDLSRFRESVIARRWWLQTYPELVRPLGCVMPLHGRGLKRPAILRLALTANHLLSATRNRGVRADRHLDRGGIIQASELERSFPSFDLTGAKAGALWYDAMMPSSERVLMEMLRWADACGAVSLNYMRATRLLTRGSKVTGVVCRDLIGEREVRFSTRIAVSCVGPWSRRFLRDLGDDAPDIFRPSLALNLLLDRDSLRHQALAISSRGESSRAFFLCPWEGRILAGTFHAALPERSPSDLREIRERSVGQFLDQLNAAAPSLELTADDVLHVQAGELPAESVGSTALATRPIVRHLGDQGGLEGLFVVSGVKFTTARQVALHTLARLSRLLDSPPVSPPRIDRPAVRPIPEWQEFEQQVAAEPERSAAAVAELVREESVHTLDDLLLRRTPWWAVGQPELAARAATVARLLGWEPPAPGSSVR